MCCEGLYQDHLISRLDEEFIVCGIVRQRSAANSKSLLNRIIQHKSLLNIARHVFTRFKLRKYENAARPVISKLFHIRERTADRLAEIPLIYSSDINSPEVVNFISQQKPDLICVNGTNLLRQPVLEMIDNIEFGIINLHTGLSPYSRGGNCNLFMLLEHKPELVGITVHHIDKGIDSGDIIISCRPDFKPGDNYEIIDARCFYIGNEAMIQACVQLFSGQSVRIKQWLQGKLFLNRTGYYYQPSQRLEANRLIENGLLKDFPLNRSRVDKGIKTIGNFNYPDD